MNFGCGSVQPDGWVHVDKELSGPVHAWRKEHAGAPVDGRWELDIREGLPSGWGDSFDYIVANHSLSDLTFHELPDALKELHRVLKPGGVLRVLVPDFEGAIKAYYLRDREWFPQGPDLEEVDERFCTFVTWFGTVGSVFTGQYLYDLLHEAGFVWTWDIGRGFTLTEFPEIVDLDGDRTTAMIWEARK